MSPKRKRRASATTVILALGLGAGLAMAQGQNGPTNPGAVQTNPPNEATGTATATEGSAKLDHADRAFLRKAAEANRGEIELGRLAEQNSQDPQVRAFGERMVKDHTQLDQQLTMAARNMGVTLPTSPSKKDKATMDKLQGLSGAAFDKAYVRDMVKDHRKDIHEFEHEAKDAHSAEVRQLAGGALPTLREHLQLAENLPGAPGRRTARAGESTTETQR
jgi:putative membrane protein